LVDEVVAALAEAGLWLGQDSGEAGNAILDGIS
jgi:hypothetical protein